MLRFVKQLVWLLGALMGCQSAFGFALLGETAPNGTPDSTYQSAVIAYNLLGDLGAPKGVHDEYRRNTPVIYYAYDPSFVDYFGSNGMVEIDKAMAMYNSVGKVSALSADLSEYPEDSRRENFRAAAAGLWDLKSATMGIITEQLGFWEPTRWVWALHARAHLTPGPPCPANMVYDIFQLNYSIVSTGDDNYATTSYVNGVLYTYFINEFCAPPNPLADAVESPVDPLSSPFSAVADFTSIWYVGLPLGGFYTSLTRDDVGALRYLIKTNNYNTEASGLRTTEFVTNTVAQVITNTLDLNLFASQALVNDAAGLATLYPGLIITATSNFFGLSITTNITEVLVNAPLDPAGTLPSHLALSTNYTTNIVNFFRHTFANVVTNTYATHGVVGVLTPVLVTAPPFGPPQIITNSTLVGRPLPVNGVFGDFFILPTNFCSARILSNILTRVTATTNLPTVTIPTATNGAIIITPGTITFATNHAVVYLPVACPVDGLAIRGGADRIQFVRRDYDGLRSTVWDPLTNDYTLPELDITNNTVYLAHFQRRVPRPDIAFSVADLVDSFTFTYSNVVDGVTESFPFTFTINGVGGPTEFFRTITFNNSGPGNEAGPGTIEGPAGLPTLVIYNRIAPVFQNGSSIVGTNNFLLPGEGGQLPFEAWGSFDGTTNAPVVYPNGTTFDEIESLITGPKASLPSLPDANIGVAYSAQLTAVGGSGPPYTWVLAPTSPGLPAGLNISSSGNITGTPSGPPAIYDFTLRLTDSAGAFRDVQYTISVF